MTRVTTALVPSQCYFVLIDVNDIRKSSDVLRLFSPPFWQNSVPSSTSSRTLELRSHKFVIRAIPSKHSHSFIKPVAGAFISF